MQTTAKTVPNKNIYVNEATQAKINSLRNRLVAKGVDLKDHTGVVRDAVLIRWMVDQEIARQDAEDRRNGVSASASTPSAST